jgi:polysaccharide pyruvyl transferase WcaK-like protein
MRHMLIHHFYPMTRNIGDHFVQQGIERMFRTLIPNATFDLFNVNSRGDVKTDYGLTRAAVERANREADLVIVGGSNLYEGGYRWPWGVHLEAGALENLRTPLFLVGIGTGSNFLARPHKPSSQAKREIRLLNSHATFSGARDVVTYNWLHQLGVSGAELMGDPATFIFNRPAQPGGRDGHILIVLPPLRFWASKRRFLNVFLRGRAMFRAMTRLTRTLLEQGDEVLVICNDPNDVPLARELFDGLLPGQVICPQAPEEYLQILASSRAVVSGRLHTAVVAFSLAIPFILMDVDQRTHGFIETYQLDSWSLNPSRSGMERCLQQRADMLFRDEAQEAWEILISKRDRMYERAMNLLGDALRTVA